MNICQSTVSNLPVQFSMKPNVFWCVLYQLLLAHTDFDIRFFHLPDPDTELMVGVPY
jgi:hypothetical protein